MTYTVTCLGCKRTYTVEVPEGTPSQGHSELCRACSEKGNLEAFPNKELAARIRRDLAPKPKNP